MSPRKAAALRGHDDRTLRDHLLVTAEQLIAREGTVGLTVRAIARAAGVADGVLYNYFTDKDDLLAAALRAHVDAVERTLGELPEPGSNTVEANLRTHLGYGLALHDAILPAFLGLLSQPSVLAKFAEPTGDEWRDKLLAYLNAERALGRLADSADTDTATALLVGICHDHVLAGLLSGHPPTDPVDPDAAVALILRALAAAEQPGGLL